VHRLNEKREYLVFALLCLLCVGSLSLPPNEQVELARRVNRGFLLPFLLVKDDVESYLGLREENRILRTALERRSLELNELRWTRVENLKLREALGFRERVPVEFVAAEVVGTSPERLPRSFLLDKGTADGIRPNLPVVTPDGLVGKTAETDRHATLVITLRHPDFRASALALTERHAEAGIAAARPDGQLELVVPLRSTARPGDIVVTSGIGPVFPRGIPIGRISGVTEEDRLKLQKNDRIVSVVDLSRTTSVFVLVQGSSPGPADPAQPGESTLFWPGYDVPRYLVADSLGADSLAGLDDVLPSTP
jgi:rod shape-determining protein MreC